MLTAYVDALEGRLGERQYDVAYFHGTFKVEPHHCHIRHTLQVFIYVIHSIHAREVGRPPQRHAQPRHSKKASAEEAARKACVTLRRA